MGYHDHRRDHLSDWRGKRWQVGERRGEVRRAGESRWLGFGKMEWRGRNWQLGHVRLGGYV